MYNTLQTTFLKKKDGGVKHNAIKAPLFHEAYPHFSQPTFEPHS